MTPFIDLHIHTNCSDGIHTPEEVLERVREKKLSAFAITDHDTLEGYIAVRALCTDSDPALIPGMELSVSFGNQDLHLLGYFFDYTNDELNTALKEMQRRRSLRGQQMVEKLNQMDVAITIEDVHAVSGQAPVGRPHVAEVIFKSGFTKTYEEAFEKYIGDGKPAYVPKVNFSPAEAIVLIHNAGGVAVLAHPAINETYRHIEMLTGLGLDGIEAFHPAHKQWHIDTFKHMAEQYRLVVTGGSDFHGREGRYGDIGSQHVPEKYLVSLQSRAQQRKASA